MWQRFIDQLRAGFMFVFRFPPQVAKAFWYGSPESDNPRIREIGIFGFAWHIGPSWESATLDTWTRDKVVIGRSRLIRTIYGRVKKRRFVWHDRPRIDTFVDPYYATEKEVPLAEYDGCYDRSINTKRESVVKR